MTEKIESLGKSVFTTGQVAKICKVAPRTVSKWFDSGRLKGYLVGEDRRVPRDYLIRFLKEYGMPLAGLEETMLAKVLIVTKDPVMTERLTRVMRQEQGFKIAIAEDTFEAGMRMKVFCPDCILVDFSIGYLEAMVLCGHLRQHDEFLETILIVLMPGGSDPGFNKSYVSDAFVQPFDEAHLAERVRTLVGKKKELAKPVP